MVQIVMVGFPQRHNAFRKGPPVRTESPKISIGNFEKRARNACCDSTCEIACVCVCVCGKQQRARHGQHEEQRQAHPSRSRD